MGGKWRKKEEMEEWRKRERKYSNREEIERESLPLSSTFYISSYLFFLSPLRDGRKIFLSPFPPLPAFPLTTSFATLPPGRFFVQKLADIMYATTFHPNIFTYIQFRIHNNS